MCLHNSPYSLNCHGGAMFHKLCQISHPSRVHKTKSSVSDGSHRVFLCHHRHDDSINMACSVYLG